MYVHARLPCPDGVVDGCVHVCYLVMCKTASLAGQTVSPVELESQARVTKTVLCVLVYVFTCSLY